MEKLKLLSDQPIGEGTPSNADGLSFYNYATVLGDAALNTQGPFTIGVFGEWGTGKTSLMRLIEENLSKRADVNTVWFNAWRFENEEQPIVPLVATIVKSLEGNKGFLKSLSDGGKSLIRSLRAVAYGFSAKSKVKLPGFAEIEASFVAKDMIDRDDKLTPDPLLDRSIYYDAFGALSNINLSTTSRIVIIIDDLDRCFPDRAIRLLESIKLVLAQPGFIFILGVARKVLEGYLQHRYEKEYGIVGFQGQAYLDKIVQLPFHIPPHSGRMNKFWDSLIERLSPNDAPDFRKLVPIIGFASGSNPRSAVRFVNNLLVDRAIYKASAGVQALAEMHISFFAVSRSMQLRWPTMFSILSSSIPACDAVSEWVASDFIFTEKVQDPLLAEASGIIKLDQDLQNLLKSEFGRQWLREHNLRNETIDFLRTQRSESNGKQEQIEAKYDIFLGYSWDDKDKATNVRNYLEQSGLKVFDFTQMPSSNEMSQNVINTAIEQSKAAAFLIGENTDKRQNVMLEIGMATGKNKKVFPIILPGVSENSIPHNLRNFVYLKLDTVSKESLYPIVRELRK